MRVLIVGDVHGQHRRLADSLGQVQDAYRIAAAIQVGDFGFYRDLIASARTAGIRFPVPLHVIDGNHEDHAWLRRALRAGAGRVWQDELNLFYQPRSSVARLGSSTVGFLGGALHVDRAQKPAWPNGLPNYIRRRDSDRAIALFNRLRPELIVTHSCPCRIGIGMRSPAELRPGIHAHVLAAGYDPGPPDDCGEVELNRLWSALAYQPRGWVFGHFHRAHQALIAGTPFVCVSDELDAPARLLVLWDTEEKKLLLCPADPSGGGEEGT
jgi:hypothetical protein